MGKTRSVENLFFVNAVGTEQLYTQPLLYQCTNVGLPVFQVRLPVTFKWYAVSVSYFLVPNFCG